MVTVVDLMRSACRFPVPGSAVAPRTSPPDDVTVPARPPDAVTQLRSRRLGMWRAHWPPTWSLLMIGIPLIEAT